MSQENVEILRRSVEAFNRSDAEALAAICDDDMEFVSALAAVEDWTYRGKETWEAYFSSMRESWAEWRFEDAQFFEADNEHVVSVFRMVGKGKRSGARVEHPMGATYRFRDGKIWRMHSYLAPREALEAAGLSE
jgi:ketosteroid isomerase-like protein